MPHARAGDNAIYYEVHGVDTGRPPVALVMGLGSDAHAWEKQIPAFEGDRQVLALDNRGIGRSDKPPGPYSTAGLADDLAAVFDAAGFTSAHVVGISLGGMIAQEFALRHASRVTSLALLATYARPDDETRATADLGAGASTRGGGASVTAMMRAMATGSATIDFGQAFSFLMKLVFSPAYLAREAAYLQRFYFRSVGYGLSPEGFIGQVAAAMAHDAEGRIGAISVPTLVATGTLDALIAPRHSADLAQRIPGAKLVEIPNGTHGLNFEFADAVNVLLQGWFSSHDAYHV